MTDLPLQAASGAARDRSGADAQGWSEERTERLKRLWSDPDLSASTIARRLGVSRNAVLGKINRLGLSNRRKPVQAKAQRTPRPSAGQPRRRLPPPQPTAPAPTVSRKGRPRRAAPDTVGPALVDRLEDLQRDGCHWPFGDPASEAFRFCGRPAARGPYCEGHRLVAYKPGGPKSLVGLVRRCVGA